MTSSAHIALTSIIASLTAIDAIESLQGSEIYRHEIKQTGTRFTNELLKYTSRNIPLVWGVDDEVFYKIMDYMKQLAQKLSHLSPEELGIVLEFINIYQEQPEQTLDLLDIKITAE